MTSALTVAVENPVQGKRITEVPEICAACAWKAVPIAEFWPGDLFALQSNTRITKGACPWDIYSLRIADEMVGGQTEWPSKTWTTFTSESRALPKTCGRSSRN